ncbi:MAG: hypothetical protein DMG77_09185 [Acidobacteria bacterium]|nr:MAG: hypothetical protein DMG77_09185 [Acidobacteriota bacterium]
MLLASLCVAPIRAQKNPEPSPPKYDARTELKTKGIVEEVKLPPKGSEKEIAHLLLKNSTETVDVCLCSKSFLDDMGVSFGKGRRILGRSFAAPASTREQKERHLQGHRGGRRLPHLGMRGRIHIRQQVAASLLFNPP